MLRPGSLAGDGPARRTEHHSEIIGKSFLGKLRKPAHSLARPRTGVPGPGSVAGKKVSPWPVPTGEPGRDASSGARVVRVAARSVLLCARRVFRHHPRRLVLRGRIGDLEPWSL